MTQQLNPPKYRQQKSRNLAVVRIHGKDHYLGEYGSSESKQRYARLITEKWADSAERSTARSAGRKHWLTVDELILQYMTKHVPKTYLNKQGKPTDRYYHVKIALRPLHALYGNTPVNEFGSKRLKMVREQMIQNGLAEKGGYSRHYVNDHVVLATRARSRKKAQESPNSGKIAYTRGPRSHYNDETYCRAVKRACLRAGVPKWTPNQLRHTAATLIRENYGLEAAKIILGHQSAVTTEIYAEKDEKKAKSIMKEIG